MNPPPRYYKITRDGADCGTWWAIDTGTALRAMLWWEGVGVMPAPLPPHTYREKGGVATFTLTDGTVYTVEVVS